MNKTCKITVKTPIGLTKEATVSSIVQQGSVCGGILCSASTAEVINENLGNGCQIGLSNIKALAFVDDIATTNTEIPDVYTSHNSIVWFSHKKRLSLNIPKCMVLAVNCNTVTPRLKIDGIVLEIVKKAVYLGDAFNAEGSNKDLIEDRVRKGNSCIVSAIALCSEVTLGTFTVQTLLLLYKCLYLAVTLYNSQAWSKLTNNDIASLQTNQLKFLKRIFHAPSSTPNAITFLETGTLPVIHEINIRRLNFLYHILTLEEKDPVKSVYEQQLEYECEPNWANDMIEVKAKYEIWSSNEEITTMSKERWKRLVKKQVRTVALRELNDALSQLKMGQKLAPYEKLQQQDYVHHLQPHETRTIFQIRGGVFNLKAVRKYWYNNDTCRLCQQETEDVEHVVNK